VANLLRIQLALVTLSVTIFLPALTFSLEWLVTVCIIVLFCSGTSYAAIQLYLDNCEIKAEREEQPVGREKAGVCSRADSEN
jgi:hypothetical protein